MARFHLKSKSQLKKKPRTRTRSPFLDLLLTFADRAASPLLQYPLLLRAVQVGTVRLRVDPVAPEASVAAVAPGAAARAVAGAVGDGHAKVAALG